MFNLPYLQQLGPPFSFARLYGNTRFALGRCQGLSTTNHRRVSVCFFLRYLPSAHMGPCFAWTFTFYFVIDVWRAPIDWLYPNYCHSLINIYFVT